MTESEAMKELENERARRDTPTTAARKGQLTAVIAGLVTAATGLIIAITARVQTGENATKAGRTDTELSGSYEVMKARLEAVMPMLIEQAQKNADLQHRVDEIARRCLTPEERAALMAPVPRAMVPPEVVQPLPANPEAAAAQVAAEKPKEEPR